LVGQLDSWGEEREKKGKKKKSKLKPNRPTATYTLQNIGKNTTQGFQCCHESCHLDARRPLMLHEYRGRLSSASTSVAHANLFSLPIYPNFHTCLYLNFVSLTRNYFKLTNFFIILQNRAIKISLDIARFPF